MIDPMTLREALDFFSKAREHLFVPHRALAPEIPEVLHALAQEDGGIAVMRRCPKVVLKVPRSFMEHRLCFPGEPLPGSPNGIRVPSNG